MFDGLVYDTIEIPLNTEPPIQIHPTCKVEADKDIVLVYLQIFTVRHTVIICMLMAAGFTCGTGSVALCRKPAARNRCLQTTRGALGFLFFLKHLHFTLFQILFARDAWVQVAA